MDGAVSVSRFLAGWMLENPGIVLGAVAAFAILHWLLNRKSARDREAERVIRNLVDGSKDRYGKTRPLH